MPITQVPLEVGSFIVREFRLSTNEDFDDSKPSTGDLAVDFDIYLYPQTESRYYITMSIQCGGDELQNEPYGIELGVIGTFHFKDGTTPNVRNRMIVVNAPSILYGFARGFVASATGVGAHGAISLPAANLLEIAERKYGKSAEKTNDKEETAADTRS